MASASSVPRCVIRTMHRWHARSGCMANASKSRKTSVLRCERRYRINRPSSMSLPRNRGVVRRARRHFPTDASIPYCSVDQNLELPILIAPLSGTRAISQAQCQS
jgi:hypothetical protein